MKKGGFLRNVLDTIRSNQDKPGGSGGSGPNQFGGAKLEHFGNLLKPHHFSLGQVARHGFPDQPSALAFDPVQKIAAIGTKSGALRIFGRPGVDIWCQHKPEYAITHIKFVINQGAIITVTADESIHLWSLRGPNLKLQLSGGSNAPGSSTTSPPPPTSSSSLSQSAAAQTSQISSTSSSTSSSAMNQQQNPASSIDLSKVDIDFPSDSPTSSGAHNLNFNNNDQDSKSNQQQQKQKQSENNIKQPIILHTLKFQREHITSLTLTSKWLYIGTERGNVHVANVETFELSGYSIAWNKAIELSRKNHPGSIIHISECPQDSNKLLIGYESGCIVLWDLKQRNADGRYYHTENLLWLAWHYEGKQFIAAHGDGSLITWQIRSNARPSQIVYPHAKTQSSTYSNSNFDSTSSSQDQYQHQQQSLASSFARAMNNELYRPINKVEWKTSKSNEQFLLFSGGLPYDGLQQQQTPLDPNIPRAQSAAPATSSRLQPTTNQLAGLKAASVSPGSGPSQPSYSLSSASPMSPSISPAVMAAADSGLGKSIPSSSARQSTNSLATTLTPSSSGSLATTSNQQLQLQQQQQSKQQKKRLRSTSLTVMYGKAITVLEMDDTIIDFITISDNYSPYENDTSDPFVVIVLLSNDLILIDLTSSGYPSFDSPYSSNNLQESPVTTIKYLADCSSYLIPFLYSTSQNVISRLPKKGFSDKEWPINGGEWGSSMQSYPELVITGHLDGTIKFWDMSSVNFDLISKIKTSKLFERLQRLPNSIIIQQGTKLQQQNQQRAKSPLATNSTEPSNEALDVVVSSSTATATTTPAGNRFDENSCFAIEKIEYNEASKHLLVAGALSQVIQFKLQKQDKQQDHHHHHQHQQHQHHHVNHEVTTIMVDPLSVEQLATKPILQMHSMLRVKSNASSGASSGCSSGSGSSSSAAPAAITGGGSSGSAANKSRSSSSSSSSSSNAFQAELICLTQMLVTPIDTSLISPNTNSSSGDLLLACQAPPKVTALALEPNHNILAYAHQMGIVLVDVIQKCIIMNASLLDLYGPSYVAGGGSIISNNNNNNNNGSTTAINNNVNIQPFATSSLLRDHYQTTSGGSGASCPGHQLPQAIQHQHQQSSLAGANPTCSLYNQSTTTINQSKPLLRASGLPTMADGFDPNLSTNINNATDLTTTTQLGSDNTSASLLLKSGASHQNGPPTSQGTKQSRFTTNSMFQRQLSSTALSSSPATQTPLGNQQRIFQRQMTASQLLGSSSSATGGGDSLTNKQRAAQLLASARGAADPTAPQNLTLSTTCLSSGSATSGLGATPPSSRQQQQQQQTSAGSKPMAKNKRIISRMLSISAIHTSALGGGGGGAGGSSSSPGSNSNLNNENNANLNNMKPDCFDPSSGPNSLASPTRATMPMTAHANNNGFPEQQADKIDSSFSRSRSSSNSSNVAGAHLGGSNLTENLSENIQCILFLEQQQQHQRIQAPSGGHQQQQQQQQQQQSTLPTGSNNKSLGSIASTPNSLALWVGTSNGCVLMVNLTMPDSADNRVLQLQSVLADPIPQAAIRMAGSILCMSSFSSQAPLPASSIPGQSLGSLDGCSEQTLPMGVGSQASSGCGDSTSGGICFDTRTFLALVSEKEARVYQVTSNASSGRGGSPREQDHHHHQDGKHHPYPHQQQNNSIDEIPLAKLLINKANLVSRIDLSESSFGASSGVVQMRQPDENCLVTYLATGNIIVHSLPSLRLPPLMDADFVPYSSQRIASSMCFSKNGHCLYQASLNELVKFTISSQYKFMVNEMQGSLYTQRDMPEMPRANFLKSLFSGITTGVVSSTSKQQSERDELFSNDKASSSSSRNIAKHVSGMDKLKSAAVGTMGQDMRLAREGLDERGEKLGELEDKTAQMMNQAESYSQAAHQLAQKFKDKKWYQF